MSIQHTFKDISSKVSSINLSHIMKEEILKQPICSTKIVLIGGFSQAGKTSVLEILSKSYCTISSSELLHQTLNDIYWMAGQAHFDTHDSKDSPVVFGGRMYKTGRDLLIYLAEKVLVENFGRGLFAVGCVNQIIPNAINFIECIGGDEETELDKQLETNGYDDVIKINIRRHTEKPNVDIRQLLRCAVDVWNEGRIEKTVAQVNHLVGK